MAPFQGVTNQVFRQVFTRHFTGVDKLLTPFFTSIHKQSLSKSRSRELLHTSEHNIKVVPQILSKDGDEILRFAKFCHQLGFDEINWNMGCPYPRVAHKGRGSGMLQHPEQIERILQNIMPLLPVKLSVKLRLGYESPEEILEIIPVFNHFPIAELAVHARVGKQLYKGAVNVTAFEEVLRYSQIPTGYNGDIFTTDDYHDIKSRFPEIKFIMLGRGVLADPFLPAHLKQQPVPGLSEQKIMIRRFMDDLYFERRKQHRDGLQTLGNMKEYWWYLSFSFSNPHKVFGKLKKTKSFDDYEDAVNSIFNNFDWLGQQAGLFKQKNR